MGELNRYIYNNRRADNLNNKNELYYVKKQGRNKKNLKRVEKN
jgi:hypothetical protein